MAKVFPLLIALCAVSPAYAADLVEPAPVPAEQVVTTFDWTGGYVGIHKGGSWLNGRFSADGEDASENFNGFTIGKFAGYNFSFDNIVVGVEGDITYNWNDNRYHAFGTHGDVGTNLGGSLRGRLGYAVDRTLVYATGGWAVTRGFIDTPTGDEDRNFNGWTLGAGVDWAVTDNIFVRGEYRYTDYGDQKISGIKVDLDHHQALFGVAYKF